jgi:hypothetical protein
MHDRGDVASGGCVAIFRAAEERMRPVPVSQKTEQEQGLSNEVRANDYDEGASNEGRNP